MDPSYVWIHNICNPLTSCRQPMDRRALPPPVVPVVPVAPIRPDGQLCQLVSGEATVSFQVALQARAGRGTARAGYQGSEGPGATVPPASGGDGSRRRLAG